MKNFSKICAFGLLISSFFAVSCKDSFVEPEKKPVVVGDPTTISVTASTIDHKTRASVNADLIHTSWAKEDKVGLFVKFQDKWSETASLYTVNSVGADPTTATLTGSTKWQAANLPHLFYAYWPYQEGADDPAAIPVSLPSEQTQKGVGSDVVSQYNVMVAEPTQLTAPRSFTDENDQKTVELQMRGAFSIIEFRIAAYQDTLMPAAEYATVQKITLRTPKHALGFTKGLLDITQADYSLDFARVHVADEANLSYSTTLTLEDAPKVPRSKKLRVVQNDSNLLEYNDEAVFPARMVVMPNMYDAETANIRPDDKWEVEIDYTIFGRNGNVNAAPEVRTGVVFGDLLARRLRPGERHAIHIILPVREGSDGVPPPEVYPNEPWDGVTMTPPTIIDTPAVTGDGAKPAVKEVEIRTPAELAWLANEVNSGKNRFTNFTVKLMNSIDLNGHEWTPIGLDGKNVFEGHFEGAGMGDRNNDGRINATDGFLINGLSVTPEGDLGLTADIANANFGLFGSLDGKNLTGSKMKIQNLRIKGEINVPEPTVSAIQNISKSVRVGGLCGTANNVNFANCKFEGDIDVYFLSAHQLGGIVGYSVTNSVNITDCHVNAAIKLNSAINEYSSFASVGGIVGWSHGVVKGCSFMGSIDVLGSAGVGGIAGEAADGAHIKACANRGRITVDGNGNAIGGIAGILRATSIYACYNTGEMWCDDGVSQGGAVVGMGGIVGCMTSVSGQVRACYNVAKLDVGPNYEKQKMAGNIFGLSPHKDNAAYDFSRISYNYYLYPALYSDTHPRLQTTSIYSFTQGYWPSKSMTLWGTGDGSADGKYWNAEHFPTPGGSNEWAYPRLYWEIIE